MRPLRYSINLSLDGYCGHEAIPADEELHLHAAKNLEQVDALLFGRVIDEYEFVVHPWLIGHGPTLFAGLSKHVALRLVGRTELSSGAQVLRYEPRR